MRVETITCDACGADITYTTNCRDYRLALVNESKPINPAVCAVTAMGAYPAIKHDAYFCGLKCLDRWRDHERHYDKSMSDFSNLWCDEHGVRDETGRVRSYPVPPDETLESWRKTARDAANDAFPLGPAK